MLAALRHPHLQPRHPPPARRPGRQRAVEGILQYLRRRRGQAQEHGARAGLHAGVELQQKARQHLLRRRLVDQPEPFLAEQLAVPELEQGHRVVRAVAVEADVVARLAREVDHVLIAVGHLADGAHLVAEHRRLLEAQRLRLRLHARAQLAHQVGALAGQQLAHRRHALLVLRRVDVAHARRRAAPDVKVQARLVALLEHRTALAQREQLVDQRQVDVDLVYLRERPEILGTVQDDGAGAERLREPLVGEADHRVRLAVLEVDVVARLAVLDERVFQQQRLELAARHDHLEVGHLARQHFRLDVPVPTPAVLEVGRHPGTQVLRLAHVQHGAAAVLEQVHAGGARQIARQARQVGGQRIGNSHRHPRI